MKTELCILFCTDGGRYTGFGHVRRCLSLAQALRQNGASCIFVLGGERMALEKVAAAGFEAVQASSDLASETAAKQSWKYHAHAIVADSYSLRTEDFRVLKQTGATIVVIDDLADQDLPVDLVVNGSVGAEHFAYPCSQGTSYLLGPAHVLLRQEFADEPQRVHPERVRRVLITVGGSDPHALTLKLMRWTEEVLKSIAQDVVIGPLFEDVELIKSYAQRRPSRVRLHIDPQDMRGLMLAADFALCGGGQTTYELSASGTPAISIMTAANQARNIMGLAEAGTLLCAGGADDPDLAEKVKDALEKLSEDPAVRAEMACRGRALVDGCGASRVADAIVKQLGVGCKATDGSP